MVGNGGGGRGTGINQESRSNRVSGGGGGIYAVDASITWSKMPPTTDTPASVNGERIRMGVSSIVCSTTTLNASSFKRYVAGTSKN